MNMNQTDPIQAFIENNPVPESYQSRIPDPRFRYHGEAPDFRRHGNGAFPKEDIAVS